MRARHGDQCNLAVNSLTRARTRTRVAYGFDDGMVGNTQIATALPFLAAPPKNT